MKTRRLAVLAPSALLLCSGCGVWDWLYYREAREIEASLSRLPGVESAEVGGNEDVTLEDLWAKVHLQGGGELWLFHLGRDSASAGVPVVVGRAGDLFPKFSTSRSWGIFADFSDRGVFSAQLTSPIEDAPEAVLRYREIADALARWPKCPDFAIKQGPEGPVRYCTQAGKSDGWWP